MDDSLASSLGMLNSSIQTAAAAVGNVKDKDWIAKQNQLARDFTVEMWNKNNEYNSPISVMQRWREAGIDINPNYLIGQNSSMQSSLASSPGHSAPNMNSKDLAKYANIFSGIRDAQELQLQKQLVNSQLEVNKSVVEKNTADANETSSKIPINEKNVTYLEKLITNQDNQNAWFDISLPVQRELLNVQLALEANKESYALAATNRLLSQTENERKLTDMSLHVASETLAQAWKKIDIESKEAQARIYNWYKSGDAAERSSKAQLLNAITNSKLFNLKENQYKDFNELQKNAISEATRKLAKENSWYDILMEKKLDYIGKNTDYLDSKTNEQKRQTNISQTRELLDLTKSLFDFGDDLFNF